MTSSYSISDDRAFVFENGTRIHSLSELVEHLKTISDDEFRKHANTSKNDFSDWIKHSFGEEDLASFLEQNTNRDITIKVLEGFLDKADKANITNKNSTKNSTETNNNENNENNNSQLNNSQSNVKSVSKPKSKPNKGDSIKEFFEEVSMTSKEKKDLDKEEQENKKYEKKEQEIANYEHKVDTLTKAKLDESSKEYSKVSGDVVSDERIKYYQTKLNEITKQIGQVFIGQDEVVEKVLMTLICNAHSLLEGVPGLAKTLLIETLARVVKGTTFHRIQFMPDLLPSDILGGQIFNPSTGEFMTMKGPIFANFVLADEINRAPPKTHAALMEAMQEKKISIDRIDYVLDKPFFVLATQNPLENKGTYELPEAILDRFMFKVILDYPKREHELIILSENNTTKPTMTKELIQPIVTKQDILDMQEDVKKVYISQRIREYVLDIVEATRGLNKNIEGMRFVEYGGGPRATIYISIAAKARALMLGRNYVLPEDVAYVCPSILRHRVSLNFVGKAHNISTDKIVEEILTKVQPI